MSRLFKVPATIAEYTVGTMIVLFQLGIIRPLDNLAQQRRRQKSYKPN